MPIRACQYLMNILKTCQDKYSRLHNFISKHNNKVHINTKKYKNKVWYHAVTAYHFRYKIYIKDKSKRKFGMEKKSEGRMF